jgi:hypothetical protein
MSHPLGVLNVKGTSRRVLEGILKSTPLALRGEETMMPYSNALALAGEDDDTLRDVLRDLISSSRTVPLKQDGSPSQY